MASVHDPRGAPPPATDRESRLPGLALALAVAAAAAMASWGEERLLGRAWLDPVVLAIVAGTAVRSLLPPAPKWWPGIDFAARPVLEAAIVLLGAAVDLGVAARGGPRLLAGIVLTVLVTLVAGQLIGRAAGLEPRHATLIAFGNAICGNSAIAALAPIIGARREQVASAIAFTAVLGVAVVLGLPLLIPVAHLTDYQYGTVAGLTVYAVPQVLAATLPVSATSGDVGTLVKLLRVLLLGPLLLLFALLRERPAGERPLAAGSLRAALPWFIVGFLVLASLRTAHVLPDALVAPMRSASHWLTVVAMAGLGLGVDVRTLRHVGRPATVTVLASLALLLFLGLLVARWAA